MRPLLGTPVDDDFDADVCAAAEDTLQCCLPFVQRGPLVSFLS